jgi:predicted acylesterase/phospholipase RssA
MKAGVFFGGGAFIALHAGYSKGALKNVKLDHVYGVSAGSLWASILAFLGIEKGIEILGTIHHTEDIFHHKDAIESGGDSLGRRWASIPMGYSYKPLQFLLEKYIVGNPTIPVTVSKVNLETGRHYHITALPDGTFTTDDPSGGEIKTLEDFRVSVLSSCLTYPIVDAYLDHQNRGWVDGGFREGGPVQAALNDGMEEIHLCLTGLYSEEMDFSGNANDPLSGATRLLEICANQNIISAVNAALDAMVVSTEFPSGRKVFIYQVKGQGSSENFNQLDIQRNIAIGAAIMPVDGKDIHILD